MAHGAQRWVVGDKPRESNEKGRQYDLHEWLNDMADCIFVATAAHAFNNNNGTHTKNEKQK